MMLSTTTELTPTSIRETHSCQFGKQPAFYILGDFTFFCLCFLCSLLLLKTFIALLRFISVSCTSIHGQRSYIKITIIIIFIFGIRNENKQLPYLFFVSELCLKWEWCSFVHFLFISYSFVYRNAQKNRTLYCCWYFYYYYRRIKVKKAQKTEMLHFTSCHSLFIEVHKRVSILFAYFFVISAQVFSFPIHFVYS